MARGHESKRKAIKRKREAAAAAEANSAQTEEAQAGRSQDVNVGITDDGFIILLYFADTLFFNSPPILR